MSRDDEIDYTVMYPVGFRNRKRRSANPRAQNKKSEPSGGIFRAIENSTKARTKKAAQPRSQKASGKEYNYERGTPRPSMTTVAKKMWAKDLDLSVDQVMLRLERLGYEAAPDTISSIKREIFDVLRLCQKHGSITVHASWGE